MVFTVLAAVDLGGKCNFELLFHMLPTISELRQRIDEVMAKEAALRRPPQAGPFRIHRAQVFDERMEMWVDLVASSQLEDYCQVYVFQKESPWHKDTPGRIPPPVKPVDGTPFGHARSSSPPAYQDHAAPLYADLPFREGSGSPYAHSPQHVQPEAEVSNADKARAVYEEMDTQKNRAVTSVEWGAFFERTRLCQDNCLTAETLEDLFNQKADRNEDGIVTFPEFQYFGELYPKTLESMYYRLRKVEQEKVRQDRLQSQYDQLEDAQKRLDDSRQAALEAESEALDNQSKIDEAERDIESAREAEKAAAEDKKAAHDDTEAQRKKVREARAEEAAAKEEVKKAEAAKRQAQRSVDVAEKKREGQEKDLEKLNRELEMLMRRVEDKQKEIEKQQAAIADTGRAVEEAQQKAGQAEDPQAESAAKERGDAAKAEDEELKRFVDAEAEKTQQHRETQRATTHAQQQKSALEQQAQQQKASEHQRKAAEQRAEKAVEDIRKAVEASESHEAEEDSKRFEEEEKENELVQMEVRLREQREAVEKKEQHLRTAHREFSQDTGRAASMDRH
eukprot:Rhum_TRINITY_DN14722_c1_g1::Rhum_TRINITY_DN14722_c1_g1_i2::g.111549::m.111549